MKFLLPALIIGAVLNIFFFHPYTDAEIRPEWTGSIKQIQGIEQNIYSKNGSINFPIRINEQVIYLNGNGKVIREFIQRDNLFSISGNGEYIITYKQAGNSIELYNKKGDRFWMIDSLEYPYLSQNGKLAFLVNGDHSHVRIIDHNGNEMGVKKITGRMCTAIGFSDTGDFGSMGFLDGSFYFINEKGNLLFNSRTELNTIVKGITISSNGAYGAVHHGTVSKDMVTIIDFEDRSSESIDLKNIHHCKTAIHISKEGTVTIHDNDRIVNIDNDGDMNFAIDIPVKRQGSSKIIFNKGLYGVSYTMMNGEAKLLLFTEDGTIYMDKKFPSESFLNCNFNKDLILLQGSDNLYCYSIHELKNQK